MERSWYPKEVIVIDIAVVKYCGCGEVGLLATHRDVGKPASCWHKIIVAADNLRILFLVKEHDGFA
jgi:hypothetical protein